MANPKKEITSSDSNGWRWGFSRQSESWNGRMAMIGFVSLLLVEVFSGQGFLHFWNLMQTPVAGI